jgi:hypothetical protein
VELFHRLPSSDFDDVCSVAVKANHERLFHAIKKPKATDRSVGKDFFPYQQLVSSSNDMINLLQFQAIKRSTEVLQPGGGHPC